MANLEVLALWIVLAPLAGALVAGLFGRTVGRSGAHTVTIAGVAVSALLSFFVFKAVVLDGSGGFDGPLYVWGEAGGLRLEIGFLIDELSATMMLVVTSVSLVIHVYTIGYMADDPGYQRFFSYISLFTFAMLMLVTSNNFLQLFFGWEAVGVVSYLLIGFWFKRESAIQANLKAFLVNRVGDLGFLLGIAAVLTVFGTLDYASVFAAAPARADAVLYVAEGVAWPAMTVICLLLFVGAMGKSAQVPLHVWLPDSMEGPTPISALIHAATMVTAGIFMVARMSPLFELSETALNVVMVIGALTAFFMGLLGLVQHDIKRVVAYSTLSQLGYMTVALGASAYAAAIFHLGTHAFFKALLFLAAGSVIIALHHEQDMRRMGGLWRRMPVTWICALVGTLALIGFPGFSGFFSKDGIIEAVRESELAGAWVAYPAVLIGVFVTALYALRMYFLVFHGEDRVDEHAREHLHESPLVITGPLVVLALFSAAVGWPWVEPMLFGDYFGEAIVVAPEHDVLGRVGEGFGSAWGFALHGFATLPFWLAAAGTAVAWYLHVREPWLPEEIARRSRGVYRMLVNKYGFDDFYGAVFAGGTRGLGGLLWRFADVRVIDGWIVNGSARAVGRIAAIVRHVQTGLLYHYAFAMILGLLALMTWLLYG